MRAMAAFSSARARAGRRRARARRSIFGIMASLPWVGLLQGRPVGPPLQQQ
jgi:hypothetical protein